MALESATYVSGLVQANPPGTDPISQGDDHLRLIKKVLLNSFPNADAALNAIHTKATAPSSTSAGLLWFDTTYNVLKVRDETNSSWITLGVSPVTSFKLLGSNTVGWTLPTAEGTSGQALTTNAAGALVFSTQGKVLGTTHKIDSSSNRPASNDTYENTGMTVAHTKLSATSNLYIQFDCYINASSNFTSAAFVQITGYLGASDADPATIIAGTSAHTMILFEDVGEGAGVTWDFTNTFSRTYKVTAANCPDGTTGVNTFRWVDKFNDRDQTTAVRAATWMVWEVEV